MASLPIHVYCASLYRKSLLILVLEPRKEVGLVIENQELPMDT
jgi:hypothetical protein